MNAKQHKISTPLFHRFLSLTIFILSQLYANAISLPEKQLSKAKAFIHHQPDSAFILANSILKQKTLSTLNNFNESKSHQIIGLIFFHQSAYKKSLQHFLKAQQILSNKESLVSAELYHQIGKVYERLLQHKKASEFQEKALHLFRSLHDQNGIAMVYGSLGHLHEKKMEYEHALSFQFKALAIYDSLQNSKGKSMILEHIGSVYEDQSNFIKARTYFEEALQLNQQSNDQFLEVSMLNNIGDTYRKTAKYDQALSYYQASLQLANKLHSLSNQASNLRDLAKVHHLLEQNKEAFELLEKAKDLNDEIFQTESARQIALMQTMFETEEKNTQLSLLAHENHLSSITKFSFIVVTVLVVLIALLIILRQKTKLKLSRKISSQKEKIYQAENELIRAELENKKLAEQQFEMELKIKGKELTSHTLHNIQKNKILEELKTNLQDIINQKTLPKKQQLTKILKIIEKSYREDKHWDEFKQVFEKVHQTFFDSLHQKHKNLSSSDIKLAAMIKLNMNSKDIATLMGISQDSLRIARYRLRKKLEMQKGENLFTYIQSL